jgi:acyl-CoA oxidase
MDTKELGAALL